MVSGETETDDYDSWEMYQQALQFNRDEPKHPTAKAYTPSPQEIKRRIRSLKWLQQKQFSDKLQDAIMIYDCPTIDVVKRMVQSVGLRETKQRLMNFLKDE